MSKKATCDFVLSVPCHVSSHACVSQNQPKQETERDAVWHATSCLVSFVALLRNKHSPGSTETRPGFMQKCHTHAQEDSTERESERERDRERESERERVRDRERERK